MNWEEEDESNEQSGEEPEKKEESQNDSDSDDQRRRVRTPKQKLKDLIKENYHSIKNSISKNDFSKNNYTTIYEKLENTLKNTEKILSTFPKEEIPIFFLELLTLAEESINISKEDQKNLKKEMNTSLNNIKKILIKHKKLENLIKEYKLKRPNEEELKKEELEDEEEEKENEKSDESESEEVVDIIKLMKLDENKTPAERRLKWVKKEKKIVEKKDKEEKDEKKKKVISTKSKFYDENESENIKKVEEEKITEEQIIREYNEMYDQRGQSKSPIENSSRLLYLFTKTENLFLKIKLLSLSNLIVFDSNPGQLNSISLDLWDKIYNNTLILLQLYDELILSKNDKNNKDIENIVSSLQNDITFIIEKLENELYKLLQFTDNNSIDYISVIKNECYFLSICKKLEIFYQSLNNKNAIAKIYLLVILHLYYKNEDMIKKTIKKLNIKINEDDYLQKMLNSNSKEYFKSLCNEIYQYLDEKNKVKAMLCNVYYLCIKNNFEEAKSLFNSSYSYEIISIFKDEQLKTLFNRTFAQLGLCAFRNGKLNESLLYLQPLCSNGTTKLKEYLSQSYNKENEKNILFDKDDKKRSIPHLMLINVDEVECVFYLSSMICDITNILLNKLGTSRNIKSFGNFFSKMLINYEKQIFNGPPESNKERVLCCSQFIIKGDWKNCLKGINNIKLFNKYSYVKNMISEKVKKIALKCFLIFYQKEYKNIKLSLLEKRFELNEEEIRKIINDMILDGELKAKWRKNILKMISDDRDTANMMKKLVNNVEVISRQNLELLQASVLRNLNEDN